MRLNQVTVPATDIVRSTDFYLRLGLRQIVAAPHYTRFVCPQGDSTFSIEKADVVRPGVVVYFECDDLDSRVAALRQRGISFDSEPVNQSWLWREARCSDPDGNHICLYFAGPESTAPSLGTGSPATTLSTCQSAGGVIASLVFGFRVRMGNRLHQSNRKNFPLTE